MVVGLAGGMATMEAADASAEAAAGSGGVAARGEASCRLCESGTSPRNSDRTIKKRAGTPPQASVDADRHRIAASAPSRVHDL